MQIAQEQNPSNSTLLSSKQDRKRSENNLALSAIGSIPRIDCAM